MMERSKMIFEVIGRWGAILAVGVVCLQPATSAGAGDSWFPLTVEVTNGGPDSPSLPARYEPLSEAREKWSLCVAMPQVTGSFWRAIDYGLIDEARRLGVRMQIYEAGRYTGEQVQRKQILDCIKAGGRAVILSAVVRDSLGNLVATLADKNVPVVTLVGDVVSDRVPARLTSSFWHNGQALGRYLAKRHKDSPRPVRVAWLPGPKHAAWSEDGDRGFRAAIDGSNIELAAVLYGDTNREVQEHLVDEVLRNHDDLDYVAGNAAAAEIATMLLRKRKRTARTKIVAYYFGLGVYRGILRGRIAAAATHAPVIEARIAVNRAIRLLQGEHPGGNLRTPTRIVEQETIGAIDLETLLSPMGFPVTVDVR
jgi:periplasmic protein TorT